MGGGAGGPGMGLGSSLQTKAATSGEVAGSGDPGVKTPGYEGGPAAAAGGDGGSANPFGYSGNDGSAAGGSNTLELGSGTDQGAAVDAMANGDPEDYFTRLDLNDNLFKIVERRYGQKAMTWAVKP